MSDEKKKITARAGIVALGTLVSRLLGLVRDQVLTAFFSRASTDAFLIAFQIPNLLRQLVAEGAVQNAVLPVLSSELERKGKERELELYRNLSGLSLIALTLLTVLGMIFSEELVTVFASGFRNDPEQFQLTVGLTRVVFPYIFFMGVSSLAIAALNAYRRFTVTAFAPVLLNISFIIAALTLPAYFEMQGQARIYSLVVGALVGGGLQVLALWPSLNKIAHLRLPTFRLNDPGVRETLRRLAPTLFGVGVYYLDVLIGRRILSELGEGSVTYFSMAMRLCDFPQGIFIMALQTATLPSLAAIYTRGDKRLLEDTFAYALRLTFFVSIPATFFLWVLAQPLVMAVFQRGTFSYQDTQETALALSAQATAIFLMAGVRQLVALFFATGDTKTPVKIAALDFLVFALMAYALKGPLGHVGVSWAVSSATAAQFILLAFALKRHLPQLKWSPILKAALNASFCAACAGGSTLLLLHQVVPRLSFYLESSKPLLSQLALIMPAFVGTLFFWLVFIVFAILLKNEELAAIFSPLIKRLRK